MFHSYVKLPECTITLWIVLTSATECHPAQPRRATRAWGVHDEGIPLRSLKWLHGALRVGTMTPKTGKPSTAEFLAKSSHTLWYSVLHSFGKYPSCSWYTYQTCWCSMFLVRLPERNTSPELKGLFWHVFCYYPEILRAVSPYMSSYSWRTSLVLQYEPPKRKNNKWIVIHLGYFRNGCLDISIFYQSLKPIVCFQGWNDSLTKSLWIWALGFHLGVTCFFFWVILQP